MITARGSAWTPTRRSQSLVPRRSASRGARCPPHPSPLTTSIIKESVGERFFPNERQDASDREWCAGGHRAWAVGSSSRNGHAVGRTRENLPNPGTSPGWSFTGVPRTTCLDGSHRKRPGVRVIPPQEVPGGSVAPSARPAGTTRSMPRSSVGRADVRPSVRGESRSTPQTFHRMYPHSEAA